jgi:hypothetical protein
MRNQNQHYSGRNYGRGEQNRSQFSGNRFSSGNSNREATRGNQQPGSHHETNENWRYQDRDSEGNFLNRYDQYADYDRGSQSDDSWKWQDRGEKGGFAGYGNQQSGSYRPGRDQKAYDTDLNYGSGQTDYDNSGGGVALRINRGSQNPAQGDRNTSQGRRLSHYDDDYLYWRNEQIGKLDEDYNGWQSERRKKFSEDFDKWRSDRMKLAGQNTSEPKK